MKKLKGYRTIVFNLLVALLTALVAVAESATSLLPQLSFFEGDTKVYLTLGLVFLTTIGNTALRAITTTPIGKSE